MKFGPASPMEAIGGVTVHTLRQGPLVLKKGTTIGHAEVEALTHDPKIDDPALLHAFQRDCFYIGALGSRKTHAKRGERLKAQGAGDADIARIHAPIGLPIGAVSPSEIAVAIMAEITAQLRLPKEAKEAAA